ncbi:MAG: hypothetical protein SP1CHLAM54_02830 [Chlamydiia bacterium]|nr:hypothetical protein [Chlamydiia bacterium]MCH9615199.1 hypothetical protein [Chlamydiia bacterium]MCH9628479.1 hypothetical protein [Chlamydiia bacterium]
MAPSPSDDLPKSYGVIPIKGNKAYIVKHRNGGHWGFPKGRADGNETPLEAATRELMEESGLTIESLIQDEPLVENRKDKTVYLFLAKVQGEGKPQLDDVIEGAWVLLKDLEQAMTYPEAKAISRKLTQFF